MPIPTGVEPKCGAKPPSAAAVSLPVLHITAPGDPDKRHIRKSKSGPRRAAVLIAVNALMVTHLLLWLAMGMRRTLSPVEPSEARLAADQGLVNAGFVFFVLAILSTLILGRWFCGWGCHIVSLQDFCAWLMKKAGVKPKPFRSRLLVFAPVALGFYMFCWVPLEREVIKPLAGERWAALAPWLGDPGPRPGLHLEFTKEKFWQTFPAWYVAIPFLALCGFATVYFLGAKGYCTYGCPYGGFFGPLDRLAPGRILVTDACEHCGHCTSVCTSNVRVHEEVRDFGMVVDPGCMKCLDCVSVCPNDALYFGFARPPALSPKKSPAKRRLADAPLLAEVLLAILGVALFVGFRNMFNAVPMLMATGLAACGVFLAWKLWEMLRAPSVRLQNLQLKLKGSLRPAGLAFGALALAVLAMGGWGLTVKNNLYRASIAFSRLTIPFESCLLPSFTAPPDQQAAAEHALRFLTRAAPPSEGGWGWDRTVKAAADRAYLNIVLGRTAEAERWVRETIDRALAIGDPPSPDAVRALGPLMARRGAPLPDIAAAYRSLIARAPASADSHLSLAQVLAATGDQDGAIAAESAAMQADPLNARTAYAAASMLQDHNRMDLVLANFEALRAAHPASAALWAGSGMALLDLQRPAEAAERLREALRLQPASAPYMQALAAALRQLGQEQEASTLEKRANELSGAPVAPGPHRP